jgi:hypothetical protein
MNENNPDKSGLVQKEILHFVQNDKLFYVIVDKPVLEQREGTVKVSIQSKMVTLSIINILHRRNKRRENCPCHP